MSATPAAEPMDRSDPPTPAVSVIKGRDYHDPSAEPAKTAQQASYGAEGEIGPGWPLPPMSAGSSKARAGEWPAWRAEDATLCRYIARPPVNTERLSLTAQVTSTSA